MLDYQITFGLCLHYIYQQRFQIVIDVMMDAHIRVLVNFVSC
jgi:hypothetical protein